MSPLNINILLHYHYSPTDYTRRFIESEPAHARSEAVSIALMEFAGAGLLDCRFGDVHWATRQDPREHPTPLFQITEKGRAMVEAICAVQIPICKWVQP